MNAADTAWMLVSTALVLLMTPALGFFYGGLVRSKNALNTLMMSVVRAGLRGRGLGAPGLLAGLRRGQRGARRPPLPRPQRRRSRGAGHDPAPALHGLPGHVRHHHGGADLGRHRGADALRTVPGLPHPVGALRLRARGALGLGRRLAVQAGRPRLRGRHRRPRQRRRGGAGGGARARTAQGLRPPGHPPAQRGLHRAGRRPAVVRLVRLQRGQRAGRQRARRLWPSRTPCWPPRPRSWCGRCSTSMRTGKATAVGAATGMVVGPGRHHARGRLRRPHGVRWPSAAIAAVPELLRAALARAHAPRRLARRGGRARPGRDGGRAAHRRLRRARPGTAPPTACSTATPRQLGIQAVGGAGRHRVQRGGHLRPAEARRPRSPRCARTPRDEGLGLDVSQHGEEAYARGEGAILVLPDASAAPAPRPSAGSRPQGGRA